MSRSQTLSGVKAYPVVRVVDGDTMVLAAAEKEIRVRLIGVDTPETVHPSRPVEAYGKEASAFLANLLLGESGRADQRPGGGAPCRSVRILRFLGSPSSRRSG